MRELILIEIPCRKVPRAAVCAICCLLMQMSGRNEILKDIKMLARNTGLKTYLHRIKFHFHILGAQWWKILCNSYLVLPWVIQGISDIFNIRNCYNIKAYIFSKIKFNVNNRVQFNILPEFKAEISCAKTNHFVSHHWTLRGGNSRCESKKRKQIPMRLDSASFSSVYVPLKCFKILSHTDPHIPLLRSANN